MRTEATLEEWKALYDVAIRLKDVKPWEELWDMDLITILPKGKKEPCICSVMGRGGECYAIGAYNGINSIHNFFEMVNNHDVPSHQLIRYQNNIMCNFGNRDELTKKELTLIKELGFKFRGKNNWIYFRVFETGYAPYMPDKNQVLEFTGILKNLYMAIKALHTGLEVDFKNGNTLMRRFDEKNNQWINYEMPVFIPKVQYSIPSLEDQLLIKKLKKQHKVNSILELDIAYLNSTINDRNYDKPLIPRLCILVDGRSRMILSQAMVTPEDDDVDIIFGTIINYIFQKGKPKQIVVRDTYILSILIDLCKQIGIDIVQSGKLKGIDEFLESFYEYRIK
ncbi:hypothetical protein CLHOM_21330 [Clostridium homopropionicum DSM 5847]|uniref:Uncharacterized protein n=1 Tax=Clostridium homopropionicum DSM 5847 TaxID=1121318 RepID=A0A0L6Z967_9CLOT|nr:hypothetical protein [Clostridium homopropionicum]KOA19522.1 hypothetical protein CLHOM_21330 [Clostridium homopropionicum DSM 5847]SFG92779.1 hypothetical protein SAMN04488501_12423 [Clostridium homopropionicum]